MFTENSSGGGGGAFIQSIPQGNVYFLAEYSSRKPFVGREFLQTVWIC